MAEVDIQKREHTGMPGWVWIVIVLAIIAIIWWAIAANSGREMTANPPATPNATATGNSAAAPGAPMAGAAADGAAGQATERATEPFPLTLIRENPTEYAGKPITGFATVDSVVGTSGFWITQDGAKMFVAHDLAVTSDEHVQAGDKVSLTATVREINTLGDVVPGFANLDESTRQALQAEPVFLKATNLKAADTGTAPTSP